MDGETVLESGLLYDATAISVANTYFTKPKIKLLRIYVSSLLTYLGA